MVRGEKIGNLSKEVELFYVKRCYIHRGNFLWKSPVENPVENVENLRLSTAISGDSQQIHRGKISAFWFA